jgi:hypothetical protein
MAISESAQRNHDALFPGHVSTLKVTDPELVEIFDNWAFGRSSRTRSWTRERASWCSSRRSSPARRWASTA